VNTAALPGPLRHFLAQLDELRSGDAPDMGKVGAALVELAADQEFFGPLIAQMPAGSPEVNWLIQPERGPRLVLVHRPEGERAYTHSHPGGRAELTLADERALHRGDVATLVPPHDVHNHGHITGTGPSPYSLILLGDDMLLFEREEYDPERGTWQQLAPGDPGRSHR
jgi:hypothetical protein